MPVVVFPSLLHFGLRKFRNCLISFGYLISQKMSHIPLMFYIPCIFIYSWTNLFNVPLSLSDVLLSFFNVPRSVFNVPLFLFDMTLSFLNVPLSFLMSRYPFVMSHYSFKCPIYLFNAPLSFSDPLTPSMSHNPFLTSHFILFISPIIHFNVLLFF